MPLRSASVLQAGWEELGAWALSDRANPAKVGKLNTPCQHRHLSLIFTSIVSVERIRWYPLPGSVPTRRILTTLASLGNPWTGNPRVAFVVPSFRANSLPAGANGD